jgi:TusA-related sulfurtransferase
MSGLSVDLTMYGCPMHYIKAREAVRKISKKQTIELLVNSGDAVEEVLRSLQQDGQQCEVESLDVLTSRIRVKRNT